MIRHIASALVGLSLLLLLYAEVQRLDDMTIDQVEQLQLERVARVAQ
jgi:hypothetical protein